MEHNEPDYQEPIEIADGIFWVGYADDTAGLHCNPYLIVEGSEAVLIDGGSRDDFSTVMLKVMRAGISPNQICRLIYHHYDPDLCGNIPHLEALIHNPELQLISHQENIAFIRYYSTKLPMRCIETMNCEYVFSSGRRLRFIRTPYAHSPGSFMTYDIQTKTLFSSDLFGSYDSGWSLFSKIDESCEPCDMPAVCPLAQGQCQLNGMIDFHQRIMTSAKALRYALEQVETLDVSIIASQHGGILTTEAARTIAIARLKALDTVGFDYFMKGAGPCSAKTT